jgi:L-Ala-D/L-Glu epimerase
MKITRIDCIPFNLPLKNPVRFAGGRLAVSEHVLVQVHTADGLVGTAEAPSRPFFYGESQASMIEAVRKWFAPALMGRSALDIEHAWAAFREVEHNDTIKGALDIALHDIVGQALSQPCHRLLGGWSDSARITYICGYGEPQAMAEEALAVRERWGITSFKLKVGIDAAQDVRMLHTLRAALPEELLYVDGNSGLNGRDALRVLDAASEIGLAWAEEPVHRDDRPGRAMVQRHTRVPIMGDESCRNPEETARELADGFVQLVGIKTARTGFRVSRDILAQCAALRVRNVIASQGDSTVGVMAALHFTVAHANTASQPAELAFHLNTQADLLQDGCLPTIVAGHMQAPTAPGLGLRLDPDKLAHYRVDR